MNEQTVRNLIREELKNITAIIREELRANNANIEEKIEYYTNHLPFATYLGEDIVLTKSYFNVMYLVSSHDSIVAPYLIKNGVYETELTKYLLNTIKPDSVFVDVGANIGYYTCLAAKRINAGKVFAFEANETAYQLLQRNIMINWVDCPTKAEFVAVSDKKGEVVFKNYKYKFVNSQFFTGDEGEDINSYEVKTVPTISLDEYFSDGQKIDFLKVDVEGAEYKVLQGARQTLANNPDIQILMEWSIPQLQSQGVEPNEVLEFFQQRGFKPSVLDWRDGSATEVDYAYVTGKEYICSVRLQK